MTVTDPRLKKGALAYINPVLSPEHGGVWKIEAVNPKRFRLSRPGRDRGLHAPHSGDSVIPSPIQRRMVRPSAAGVVARSPVDTRSICRHPYPRCWRFWSAFFHG